MHSFGRTVFLVAWLLVVSSTVAQATTPWVAVSVGRSMYSLDDMDRLISELNAEVPVGLGNVENGFEWGGELGLDRESGWVISIAYERLTGIAEQAGSSPSILEVRTPANLYKFTFGYRLWNDEPTRIGLRGSLGVIQTVSKFELRIPENSRTLDLKGTGPVLEVAFTLDRWFGDAIAISPMAGYRYARIGTVKLDGVTGTNEDGSNFTLDYSGPFVRFALKIGMKPKSEADETGR